MAIKYSTKVAQLRSRLYKENRPGKEGHPPSPDSFFSMWSVYETFANELSSEIGLSPVQTFSTNLILQLKRFATQANEHKKSFDPLHKPTTRAHALIIQKSAPTHALFSRLDRVASRLGEQV